MQTNEKQMLIQSVFDQTVVRSAPHLAVDLLAGDRESLKRRIEQAGVDADRMRRTIQVAAERRLARPQGSAEVNVRLYGWPILVTFEGQHATVRHELQIYTRGDPRMASLAGKIRTLWTNHFDASGAAAVMPLSHAVHLNAVMAGDPATVNRCTFNGASILEGRQPAEFRFAAQGPLNIETAGDAVAVPYLLLAYVATPASKPDPVPKLHPSDKYAAEQLMAAVVALAGRQPPKVQVFAPQGFFNALDTLQLEHQWAFAEWAERRGLQPTFTTQVELAPTGIRHHICGRHNLGPGEQRQQTWTVDTTWRPADSQKAIITSLESRMAKLRSPTGYFPGNAASAYTGAAH